MRKWIDREKWHIRRNNKINSEKNHTPAHSHKLTKFAFPWLLAEVPAPAKMHYFNFFGFNHLL